MMCCPLTTSDDYAECGTSKIRKARKQHRCCECRESILAGTRYLYESGVFDHSPYSYKTCISCSEIRNHFACDNGYTFGYLWGDLEEMFFPSMKAGGPCMEGLSPENKARLFERRLAWLLESQ